MFVFNQAVYLIQEAGDALYFIDDDPVVKFGRNEIFQTLGSGQQGIVDTGIQKIDEDAVGKDFLTQVVFPVPLGPKRKKLLFSGKVMALEYISPFYM